MDIQFDRPTSNLDFEVKTPAGVAGGSKLPPLPHQEVSFSTQGLHGKSEVIDTLLNQIEDLSARLKVNIRKLSNLEEANIRLMTENKAIVDRTRSFEEQVLIIKEKDQVWKDRNKALSIEKDQAVEKMRLFETQFMQQAQEISRLKKFHDKVKSQVRPYIGNLKALAQSLESQVHNLTETNTSQKTTIEDLKSQILEMSKNFQIQIDAQQRQYNEVVNQYESEMSLFRKTQDAFHESQQQVDTLLIQVERLKERSNTFENELIATTRLKEEQRQRFETEIQNQTQRAAQTAASEKSLLVENTELRKDNEQLKSQNQILRNELNSSSEQLEALRFMWNAKNEEFEKKAASYQSLQKLNLELSQKIQSLRTENENLKIQRP